MALAPTVPLSCQPAPRCAAGSTHSSGRLALNGVWRAQAAEGAIVQDAHVLPARTGRAVTLVRLLAAAILTSIAVLLVVMFGQGAAGAREFAWQPAQPGSRGLIAAAEPALPEPGAADRAAVRGAFETANDMLARTGGARPAFPGDPPGSSDPDHRSIQPQWRYLVRSQGELTPEVRVRLWLDAQQVKDAIADNDAQQRRGLGNQPKDSPRLQEFQQRRVELWRRYDEIQQFGPVPPGLDGLTAAELRSESRRLAGLIAGYETERKLLLDGKPGLPPPRKVLEQESELGKVIDALRSRHAFIQGILEDPPELGDPLMRHMRRVEEISDSPEVLAEGFEEAGTVLRHGAPPDPDKDASPYGQPQQLLDEGAVVRALLGLPAAPAERESLLQPTGTPADLTGAPRYAQAGDLSLTDLPSGSIQMAAAADRNPELKQRLEQIDRELGNVEVRRQLLFQKPQVTREAAAELASIERQQRQLEAQRQEISEEIALRSEVSGQAPEVLRSRAQGIKDRLNDIDEIQDRLRVERSHELQGLPSVLELPEGSKGWDWASEQRRLTKELGILQEEVGVSPEVAGRPREELRSEAANLQAQIDKLLQQRKVEFGSREVTEDLFQKFWAAERTQRALQDKLDEINKVLESPAPPQPPGAVPAPPPRQQLAPQEQEGSALEPERPEATATAAVGEDQPQETLSAAQHQQQPPASEEELTRTLPEEAVVQVQAGTPQPPGGSPTPTGGIVDARVDQRSLSQDRDATPDDSSSAGGVDLFDNSFTTAV